MLSPIARSRKVGRNDASPSLTPSFVRLLRATIAILRSVHLAMRPARDLTHLVQTFWIVRDLEGRAAGGCIRTSPHTATILTINFARPNLSEQGLPVPRVSLLGLQNRVRSWRPTGESDIVMALLTPAGAPRLFPGIGQRIVDSVVELGAVVGDRTAGLLPRDATAGPAAVVRDIERWLRRRIEGTTAARSAAAFAAAIAAIGDGASVDLAAASAEISPRQLERWCQAHLGIGPKRFAMLHRLQASLAAVQSGQGDGADGFADQAHQIRTWGRFLDTTPGRYLREQPSQIAKDYSRGTQAHGASLAFYL